MTIKTLFFIAISLLTLTAHAGGYLNVNDVYHDGNSAVKAGLCSNDNDQVVCSKVDGSAYWDCKNQTRSEYASATSFEQASQQACSY